MILIEYRAARRGLRLPAVRFFAARGHQSGQLTIFISRGRQFLRDAYYFAASRYLKARRQSAAAAPRRREVSSVPLLFDGADYGRRVESGDAGQHFDAMMFSISTGDEGSTLFAARAGRRGMAMMRRSSPAGAPAFVSDDMRRRRPRRRTCQMRR